MATLSSFVTGQSIAASIEKTYIKAPDSLFSSLWVTSGAGISVSTETATANLPEGTNKSTALKILRASGTDYVRYRFKLDAADTGKAFKLFWNQIYGGAAGEYTISMFAYSDASYSLNQAALTLDTSSVPAGTTSFYTTVAMPAYALTPYIELRINGISGTSPLYLSGIIVGPGTLMQGAVITDWQTFSTTLSSGFGGGTAAGLRYRREGTDMIISGTFQSGSHTANPGTITLPSGFTVDFTKVAPSNRGKLGRFEVMNSGGGGLISSTDREGVLFTDGTSATLIYFAIQTGTAAFTQNNPTSIASSNSYFTVDARIPIAEWSGSGVTLVGPSAQVEYAYNTSTATAASDTSSFASGSQGALIGAITADLERRVRFTYPIQTDDILIVELSEDRAKWQPLYHTFLNAANTQNIQAWTFQNGLQYGLGRIQFINATDVDVSFGQYAFASSTYGAAGVSWSAAGATSIYWRVRKAKAVAPVGISSSSGGGGSGFLISTKTSSFSAETLNHYLVDTSSGAVTATLPSGATSATIKFSDDARTWATQLFTVQPATGEKIDGLGINESLICDVTGAAIQLSWDGTKWVLDTNAIGSGIAIQTTSQAEKNYIPKPDNANSDWATSSGSLVLVATETSNSNLPENATKTTAIRITRVSGTTGYIYARMIIDTVDASKKMKIQWNQKYAGASGDYTLQVFSFTASDYTTGSTQLAVQTTSIPSGNTTFVTTFDSPASTAPYLELRIVAAAGTTPLYLSGILIGPGLVQQSAALSEWQTYTPTLNSATSVAATYPKGQYRRIGSSVELAIAVLYTGAGDNSFFTFSLPTGLTVNTSALAVNNTLAIVGAGETRDGVTGSRTEFSAGFNNGTLKIMLHGQNNYYNTSATNNNYEINLKAMVPVSEWASSGTVNLGPGAQIEYAYNSDVTSTGNPSSNGALSSSVNGADGVVFAAAWSVGTNYQRRVRFQHPIQSGDLVQLEINNPTTGVWGPLDCRIGSFVNTTSTYNYGANVYAPSSGLTTDIEIVFSNGGYGIPASFGTATGAAWSSLNGSGFRWRVRKAKASSPVGFGIASAANGAGLYLAGAAPGYTGGSPISSGNVSEIVEATSFTTNYTITTSYADITNASISVNAGTWKIYAELTVQIATGASAGNETLGWFQITNNAGTKINNALRVVGHRAAAAVAGGVYAFYQVPFTTEVYPTTTTTYKLQARITNPSGTGAGTVYADNTFGQCRFYAIRIA